TASAFMALAAALVVLTTGRWRPVKWICGWYAIGIGAVSALGYLWNAEELVTDQLLPPVAINTALVFMALGFGILHAGRRAWELRAGISSISWLSVEAKVLATLV